jgi:integrase/recombinase XerD
MWIVVEKSPLHSCSFGGKGVPLEEVSKLLGHESIKTTERHYAKWIKGRQDRLDSSVVASWKTGKARKK